MSEGRRVSTGRLRVDAARAVDKLRDYQLPDPTAWVLEVIRAAVAFGATAIRVTGDADDVRVAWDGPGPDAESLARLFDELVDPAPKRERRAHRLLATGVNTALGLEPRWIDVIVTDGEGRAMAARYSARLLETTGDGSASRLRELRAEPRTPPREAPAKGGLVHLRRLPLLDAVPLMVGYGEPRELSVARMSCDDSRVPVRVGQSELGHARSHADLLRLALGDDLEGFVALIDPTFAAPAARLEAAELGVVLARYDLPLAALASPRAAVPLRVYVDAARMPTNASRSAVRLEESPVQESLTRAEERLPALIERLALELGDAPAHPWTPTQRERLRAAAIQLLAVHAAGEDWRHRLVARPCAVLAPLLEVPLLRDALGRPRTPRSFGPYARGIERVHLGRDPLPTELEPWLGDSLWVPPGDPAGALLGDWLPPRASDLAKLADRHRRKRAQFARQKPREPRLETDRAHLLVVPLKAPGRSLKSCVVAEAFEVEGLAGEVALRDPRAPGAGVSLLVEGRPVARWVPESPHGLEGVATCAGLTPTVDYQSVVDDEVFARLRRAVLAAAVVAHEALALRAVGRASKGDRAREVADWVEGGSPEDAARVASVLRAGVLLALERLAAERSEDDARARRVGARTAFLESKSPLADAHAWPTVGGGWASTRELFAQATSEGAVFAFHLGRAARGPAPKGRAVYELSVREQDTLRSLLPGASFVDYGPLIGPRLRVREPGALAREILPSLGVALEVERPGATAAVAWGNRHRASLEVRHWGRRMGREIYDVAPPSIAVIEDGHLPIDPQLALVGRLPSYPIHDWTLRLARGYAGCLVGQAPPPGLHLGAPDALQATAASSALWTWIAESPAPDTELGKRRFTGLTHVPLVRRLGRVEPTTLAAVAADFGEGPIDWVADTETASFDLGGWHPIASSPIERKAFARLLGRELVDATERLASLRRHAAREQALARHRARDPVDPTALWTGPRVEVKGQGLRHAAVTLATGAAARVRVLIETRPFAELTMPEAVPLEACIDLPPSAADDDFVALGEVGERRVDYVLGAGARALLLHVAEASAASLTAAPDVRRLLEAWCARIREHGGNATDREAIERLAACEAFGTIQGPRVALAAAAAEGGTLRVASWDEPWLEPRGDERASALDRAVLRLPPEEPERFREMLAVLWGERPIRDVSTTVARLQSARRVARGLIAAPRLEGTYDARFRFELSALLDEARHGDALEVFGIGEAALADSPRSRVTFVQGARRRVIESALVPAVHVAAHRTDLTAQALASVGLATATEKALETLIGLVVRRSVDGTPPDQLPEWTRKSLLDACLAGGSLHFERLESTPMLPTSTGGWATPSEVRMQAARFGAVWTTKLRAELAPLDPARIALRLSEAQTKQLSVYAAAVVADDELERDQVARRNLAQPPVASLEPTPEEREGALAVLALPAIEGSSAHGTITLLDPARAGLRAFRPSRSFQPLGAHPDFVRWPCVIRVDEPAFVPDRTWSGPLDDDVVARLRSRVRALAERALLDTVPVPHGKLAATRVPGGLPRELGLAPETGLEGVAWLEDEPGLGAITLHDPRGERVVAAVGPDGSPLPLHAELLVTVVLGDAPLRELCAKLHRRVLDRLADRLAGARTDRRAQGILQMFAALRIGAPSDDALARVKVPGMVPETTLLALRERLATGGFVPVCAPEEVALAQAELGVPVLGDDGTAEVRVVLSFLGVRAVGWRQHLRAKVLGGVEAEALVELAEEPRQDAQAPRPVEPPPRNALEELLLSRWNALSLPPARDARVDRRRKRPAVSFVGEHMLVAGQHPVVRRAMTELETGGDRADRLIALLLASGAGALRRGESSVGVAGEHGFLTELMRTEAATQGRK